MERIESVKNPRIKAARALHTVKGRDTSGMFLCEGEHMVIEAIRAIGAAYALSSAFALGSAFAVDTLFVDEACEEKYADLIDAANADHVFLVPAYVLESLSTVKSPQGIAAVIRLQTPPVTRRNYLGMLEGASPPFPGDAAGQMEEEQFAPATYDNDDMELTEEQGSPVAWETEGASPPLIGEEATQPEEQDSPVSYDDDDMEQFKDDQGFPAVLGDKLVLMEAVQDPGNVGTILRTMDAAGFHGAILSPGCADPFSPKALRATMGSIFRVPTMQVENAALTAAALVKEGYAVIASALDGEDFFARTPLPEKVCLIIGNEGAGITQETLHAATKRYRLPMKGGAESLNAAAAAAIMIYEIAYRG